MKITSKIKMDQKFVSSRLVQEQELKWHCGPVQYACETFIGGIPFAP